MAKILVIDDEPLVLKTVRLVLELAGHDIQEASNGRIGMETLATQKFDLVITDILMPDQEGLETISGLRRDDGAIKILAMSGGGRTGNHDFLHIARKLGANATIKKPFDPDMLVAQVAELCG